MFCIHVLHYLHVLLTSEVDVVGGIVTAVGPLPRPPLADQPAVLHPGPAPCIHLAKRKLNIEKIEEIYLIISPNFNEILNVNRVLK